MGRLVITFNIQPVSEIQASGMVAGFRNWLAAQTSGQVYTASVDNSSYFSNL